MWMGVANPSEDLLIEGRIPKGTVHPDILPLLHGRRLGHLKDVEVTKRWEKLMAMEMKSMMMLVIFVEKNMKLH